jgi:hypothetical protein
MKIAEMTVTFQKFDLKSSIKHEIAESKKMVKQKGLDELAQMYLDGYINGLRMAMCMLEEMDDGKNEVSP